MRTIKLSDLVKDDKNFNKGTEYGSQVLKESIEKYGAGRSILIDKNGKVIAGNKTLQAAIEAGEVNDNVLLIETDGKDLVAVQRSDLDLDSDIAARELAFVDNRAAEVGLDWNIGNISDIFSTKDTTYIPGFDDDMVRAAFTPNTPPTAADISTSITSAVCPHCGGAFEVSA